MAYSKFTLIEALSRFSLSLEESRDLFNPVPTAQPGELLRATLEENIPLALALQTEKARSEFLIAPVLLELRRQATPTIGLFSGIEFNVDDKQGLSGICDFLLARSKEQLVLRSPVLAIIESKNENLKPGYGQCIAAMVAARLFNERAGTPQKTICGAVTSGDIWKFLTLESDTVCIDQTTYYIDRLDAILGILLKLTSSE